MLRRLFRPLAELREGEAATALLMFAYSFLAMAGYNVIKPVTRGLFIEKLGAENLPWVQFGAGIAIGLIMQGYTKTMALVPRRWIVPITLTGITVGMAAFYFFFVGLPASKGIAVAFYLFGLIIAVLLISQFWTLANDIYDPRQAKRIFGFIGAGSSLGGFAGAMTTSSIVERVGANAMLLVSTATLVACTAVATTVIRREPAAGRSDASRTGEDTGVGGAEAWRLLASSRHLQLISMVIGFAAICAAIIEQQINMATAEAKGAANVDAVTAFLAQITAYLSLIGFVVQLGLTSRIHRALGIGFALMILPVADAATGVLMLMTGALWTAGVARVADTSLRYTVDKTTREVLFLPLPVDIKYRAKPFIDVTVDRFAKGLGALLLLVLVQRWGLALRWPQLSYASLTIMALWAVFALSARRQYLQAFRRSIEQRQVEPTDVSLAQADPASVETLVGELAHPEARRVLYAIDLLEAMDKRALITPLLLHHESPEVRARALRVASGAGAELGERWLPGVRRAFADADYSVRRAAVTALAALSGSSAVDVMRPYLTSTDPSLAISAAAVLAASPHEADVAEARRRLRRVAMDTREEAAEQRRQVAQVLGDLRAGDFRALLVPLMYDANIEVARAAVESAGRLGADDFLLVPPLVTLLRHRRLKAAARRVLIGYGEAVVAPLAHFMRDPEEDRWVRRHIPSTLAALPCQASVDALVQALGDADGFLRYKAIAALGRIRRSHPGLRIDPAAVTRQILADAGRAFGALTLDHNLFVAGNLDATCLLARALQEKHRRAVARVFDLLALVHPPDEIAAVRRALAHGNARQRSAGIEYLDNLLAGDVRRRVMLLVEEMPLDERVRRGNVIYKTRPRDVEDTLAQLVHDEDPSIAAAAIQLVERLGLWSLAGDLEHVLAHRDARDWQVFEAASWALAAQRMPAARRRALWQEPLPAVEVADRLRRVPLFQFASVDELLRLAGAGRQTRHEPGRVLFMRGAAAPDVHVLLDGAVSIADARRTTVAEAPVALGLQEILEGAAMTATVTTASPAVTLALAPDELLTLLSEHVEMTQGLFRWVVTRSGALQPVVPGRADASLVARVAGSGAAADRALLLQATPLFPRATAAQLWRLATIARPVSFAAGDQPFTGGDGAAMLIVLAGQIEVDPPGGTRLVARPGDLVGMYEALAGEDVTARVVAVADTRALKIDRAELFDLLTDHTDLLQGVFASLTGR